MFIKVSRGQHDFKLYQFNSKHKHDWKLVKNLGIILRKSIIYSQISLWSAKIRHNQMKFIDL